MDSYTETEYMGGFRKMIGGAEVDCDECGKTDKYMTPKKFRSKDSEIGHLKRKFLTWLYKQ